MESRRPHRLGIHGSVFCLKSLTFGSIRWLSAKIPSIIISWNYGDLNCWSKLLPDIRTKYARIHVLH